MTRFGPNGEVIGAVHAPRPAPDYLHKHRATKTARVRIAVLACMCAAVLLVSLIGFLLLSQFPVRRMAGDEFLFWEGVRFATIICAFNWFILITFPFSAAVIGWGIGGLPRKGVSTARPYIVKATLFGALAVSGVCLLFTVWNGIAFLAGALVTGAVIGGVSGALTGWLFYGIVRPKPAFAELVENTF